MKTTNRPLWGFLFLAATAALFSLTGCGTPAQNVATAHYLAGNAFATYELGKNPASLKGLEDLATALPDMASGKITPFQMGVLNAELQQIRADAEDPALQKNVQALNQVGSIISAGIQANAGLTGGNPTATTAILSANLTDFANGIRHGIDFWKGQQSVKPVSWRPEMVPLHASSPGYVIR